MFYKLTFFKKSDDGITSSDFKNKRHTYTINLNHLLCLSDMGIFAEVTMINGDKYYIDGKSFTDLSLVLEKMTIKP